MIKKFKIALQAIKVLLAIIPLIKSLIEQVEIPGFGEDKKEAVLAALGNTIDALPWKVPSEVKGIVLNIVGGLIDILVGIFNLLGHDWGEQ